MSLIELENAVEQLAPEDFDRFTSWLDTLASERWERRFESDVKAGRLERSGQQAIADFDGGRCREL
jgi:hypothetical protein